MKRAFEFQAEKRFNTVKVSHITNDAVIMMSMQWYSELFNETTQNMYTMAFEHINDYNCWNS